MENSYNPWFIPVLLSPFVQGGEVTDGIAMLSLEPAAHKSKHASQETTRAVGLLRRFMLGPENQTLGRAIGWTFPQKGDPETGSPETGSPETGSPETGVTLSQDKQTDSAADSDGPTPQLEVRTLNFELVPLMIHGPSGFGKSQFLQALAATWSRQFSPDRVLLTNATDFARCYANSLTLDDTPRLQQRFQRADLLLIDDLQLLQRKPGAQRQLAIILEHRQQHQRPTVLAASQPLRLLGLASALTSRIASGLVLPLELPSRPTRRLMIQQLCQQHEVNLTEEAAELLSDFEPVTVPQLNGIIQQLMHGSADYVVRHGEVERSSADVPLPSFVDQSDLDCDPGNRDASFDSLRRLTNKTIDARHVHLLLDGQTRTPPETREVIRVTAQYFGLKNRNLTGSSRRKLDVLARSIAMFLMRELTQHSYHQIGLHFGRRDHTTVIHACKKVDANRLVDATTRSALHEIQRRLQTVSVTTRPREVRTGSAERETIKVGGKS